MQIGVVNVASKVTGVQIGLFNLAGELQGVLVGLISIAGSGIREGLFWADDTALVNVGFKLGGEHVYSTWSAGLDPRGEPVNWLLGAGIGGLNVNVLVSSADHATDLTLLPAPARWIINDDPIVAIWPGLHLGPQF